jgi:hypothetical protein
MNETEYLGVVGILLEGFDTLAVIVNVTLGITALHIEYVDENLNVSEDVVSLARQIILHKGILAKYMKKERWRISEEAPMLRRKKGRYKVEYNIHINKRTHHNPKD